MMIIPNGANNAVTLVEALIIDFVLGAIGGVIGFLLKGESIVGKSE